MPHCISWLDPDRFVRQVINIASLYVRKDCLGCVDEGIVDVLTSLSRSLEKDELVTLGKLQSLLIRDLSVLFEVFLVADKDNGHPLISMFKHLLHPAHQVLERLSARHVVDEQCADCSSVIRARDASE